MTLARTQYLLSKDLPRPTWPQPKYWMFFPDCLMALAKRAMQCLAYHPSENGGRSRVIKIAEIRMSSYLDTSTTFSKSKIIGENPRPWSTTWKTFSWTSFGMITVGTTTRTILTRRKLGEKQNCECLTKHREHGLFLSLVCVDNTNMAGKKKTMRLVWESVEKKRGSWRTSSSTLIRFSWMYAPRLQN